MSKWTKLFLAIKLQNDDPWQIKNEQIVQKDRPALEAFLNNKVLQAGQNNIFQYYRTLRDSVVITFPKYKFINQLTNQFYRVIKQTLIGTRQKNIYFDQRQDAILLNFGRQKYDISWNYAIFRNKKTRYQLKIDVVNRDGRKIGQQIDGQLDLWIL